MPAFCHNLSHEPLSKMTISQKIGRCFVTLTGRPRTPLLSRLCARPWTPASKVCLWCDSQHRPKHFKRLAYDNHATRFQAWMPAIFMSLFYTTEQW